MFSYHAATVTAGGHPIGSSTRRLPRSNEEETTTGGRMGSRLGLAAGLAAALALVLPAAAAETPKRGGILTYMIPADAPPSFDGHKESTFATVHAFAPFYSLLVRINPDNPNSTTDIVCDLCSLMPAPTD